MTEEYWTVETKRRHDVFEDWVTNKNGPCTAYPSRASALEWANKLADIVPRVRLRHTVTTAEKIK